jgi:hypothetical protein
MTTLRLLVVLIATWLMSGCYHLGDDVHNLKAYLRAFAPAGSCKPPGESQARICYYELEVKAIDKPNGLYKGRVATKTVEQGVRDCLATKAKIEEKLGWFGYLDYECPEAKYYDFAWYGFKIEGSTPNDGDVKLLNIPNTNSMKEGTGDEAKIDPYGQRTQLHAP